MTFRTIQRALSACSFNPSAPGPLKIIVDINNPNFYLLRAREFIKEAEDILSNFKEGELLEEYNDKLIKAIRLLILAKEYKKNE